MVHGWFMDFFSGLLKFTYKWTPQTNLAGLAGSFRGRKHHFFPIIAVFQDFQTIQRLQNYLRGCPSISFNIATFLYIDSTTMSVWRPLFIKCIILDHKLKRMLNDVKCTTQFRNTLTPNSSDYKNTLLQYCPFSLNIAKGTTGPRIEFILLK